MPNFILNQTDKYPDFMVLTLDPVTNNDYLNFSPGQYVTLGFKSNSKLSPVRCFSLASSPDEKNIKIAMRESGIYTKRLGSLQPGTEMQIQGPFGDFGINQLDTQDIVMLAAGVGITPFISILKSLKNKKLNRNILLLYSSRNDKSIPFFDELQEITKANPSITVINIVADGTNNPSKKIYVGRTNDKLINQVLRSNFQDKNFMICGPSPFMEDANQILLNNSVSPEKIQIESFKQGNTLTVGTSFSIAAATYLMTFVAFVLGIGIVGSRDLRHYIEKLDAQNVTSTPAQNTIQDTTSTNSDQASPTTTSSDSSNSYVPTNSATTTNSNNTSANYNSQSYQPPVSTRS